MTAEIVVMNKNAIALAADSAVTIQRSTESGITQKIYNTTNKLFTLSKYHPVGIMVFGNSELLSIPLEVIIKVYRQNLGDKEFTSIKECAQDFIDYLGKWFSEEQQTRYFTENLIGFYSDLILSKIDDQIKEETKDDEISEDRIKVIVNNVISDCFNLYNSKKLLPHFSTEFEKEILKEYRDLIKNSIDEVFQELPLSKKSANQLIKLSGIVCTRDLFPTNPTGIVIAGFGKNELFPSVFGIITSGVTIGILKYRIVQDTQIDESNTATIIPFAQSEMVSTFIEGIDPEYSGLIDGVLEKIVSDYPKKLVENLTNINDEEKQRILEPLLKQSDNILKEINESLIEYKQVRYIEPIISTVAVLPKDELAEMAESLVNLTSFKRRVTIEAETVGGPIDVAVISKGDGFVWIKRKHYFSAELNHQFFANYFQCD